LKSDKGDFETGTGSRRMRTQPCKSNEVETDVTSPTAQWVATSREVHSGRVDLAKSATAAFPSMTRALLAARMTFATLTALVVLSGALAGSVSATIIEPMTPADEVDLILADGESDFVSRLLEQQLFEVAAQYCERSAATTNDVESQSAWELLLSECRLQQVWTLAADSRTETIRLAIQRLSDFRTEHTPSPNQDLKLRLTQLELLGVAGLIEEFLHAPVSAKQKVVLALKDSSLEFALKAVQQGQVEADVLLKQVDQVRKELNPAFVRQIRDRIRLLAAQMQLTQSRLKSSPDDKELLRKAKTSVEQIAKSAIDDSAKIRARVLLAELSLEFESADSFILKLKALEDSASAPSDRVLVESLRVRSMLRQGKPSDALESSVKGDDLLFESSSELKVLRLQCLLQIYEVLFELPDSDSTIALKSQTADEFRSLAERTLPALIGIWQERGRRVVARFDRLVQVGPKLADAFEEVASLVQSGDSQVAMEQLQQIAKSLPQTQTELRGAVLMELGQLAIRTEQWLVAEDAYRDASLVFAKSGQSSKAAASDLLRAFAIGRRWDQTVSGKAKSPQQTPEEIQTLEATYRQAIDSHIQAYATERTAATAREWRARLLADENPLSAAADLLNATDLAQHDTTTPAGKEAVLLRLCFAAECLMNCQLAANSMTQEDQATLKTLIATLGTQATSADSTSASSDTLSACLSAKVLALTVSEPSGDAKSWESRASQAQALLTQLPGAESSSSSPPNPESPPVDSAQGMSMLATDRQRIVHHAQLSCHVVLIVAAFRCLEGQGTLNSSRDAILSEPMIQRMRWIQFLSLQIGTPEQSIPGDPQLAAFLSQMLAAGQSESSTMPIAVELNALRMQSRLCPHSKDWTTFNQQVGRLTKRDLTESEMILLSRLLSELSATDKVSSKRPFDAAANEFWRAAQKRMKRGHDVWLEASLSLAEASFAGGDSKEARRILGVVSVLYPEWGDATRKARADRLAKLLDGQEANAP
jgi:hypothetical protein